MPEIIAFAGKGGVGKTTISGLLIRYLIQSMKKAPVLAVDADPNSNLNEVLGVPVSITIGDARELMKKEVPPGMTKETWMEMKVHESVIEGKGFDLLVMGRPEGQGCYCAANTLVKKHIDFLKGNYGYIVVDNEAGMEHMSRLVTQDVDHLVVVSDPTARGMLTARRIVDLITELQLHIKQIHTIVNRVHPDEADQLEKRSAEKGLELTGYIRDDRSMFRDDAEGENVFAFDDRSIALRDAYAIFTKMLSKKE